MCLVSFLFVWGEVPRGGVYGFRAIFVSARTNKRHHHHLSVRACGENVKGGPWQGSGHDSFLVLPPVCVCVCVCVCVVCVCCVCVLLSVRCVCVLCVRCMLCVWRFV